MRGHLIHPSQSQYTHLPTPSHIHTPCSLLHMLFSFSHTHLCLSHTHILPSPLSPLSLFSLTHSPRSLFPSSLFFTQTHLSLSYLTPSRPPWCCALPPPRLTLHTQRIPLSHTHPCSCPPPHTITSHKALLHQPASLPLTLSHLSLSHSHTHPPPSEPHSFSLTSSHILSLTHTCSLRGPCLSPSVLYL